MLTARITGVWWARGTNVSKSNSPRISPGWDHWMRPTTRKLCQFTHATNDEQITLKNGVAVVVSKGFRIVFFLVFLPRRREGRRLPSETIHGAPTVEEQTRPSSLTPPPQHASPPVNSSPPSLPLQPTPDCSVLGFFQRGYAPGVFRGAPIYREKRVSDTRSILMAPRTACVKCLGARTSAGAAAVRAADVVGENPRDAGGAHFVC